MSTEANIIAARPDGVTEKQARLSELMVLEGFGKADAITLAGYTSRSAGYAALRTAHVKDYITTLIREHLQESSIKAVHAIDRLITDARSDYVKLEASKDVLDRAGFKPVERHAHLHAGEVNIKIELD